MGEALELPAVQFQSHKIDFDKVIHTAFAQFQKHQSQEEHRRRSDALSDRDAHDDHDGDRNSNGHHYGNRDTDGNANSDADRDADRNPNAEAVTDSNSDAHCYANPERAQLQ